MNADAGKHFTQIQNLYTHDIVWLFFSLSRFVLIQILGHIPFSICLRIFNCAHCMFGLFFVCTYSFSWSLLVIWVYLFRDPCSVNQSVRKFNKFSFDSKQIPLKSINNNNNMKYHAVKLRRTFSYSTYWILNYFKTILIIAIDHLELRMRCLC